MGLRTLLKRGQNRPPNEHTVRICAAELVAVGRRYQMHGRRDILDEQFRHLRRKLGHERDHADPSTVAGRQLERFALALWQIRVGPTKGDDIVRLSIAMLRYGQAPLPTRRTIAEAAGTTTVGKLANA